MPILGGLHHQYVRRIGFGRHGGKIQLPRAESRIGCRVGGRAPSLPGSDSHTLDTRNNLAGIREKFRRFVSGRWAESTRKREMEILEFRMIAEEKIRLPGGPVPEKITCRTMRPLELDNPLRVIEVAAHHPKIAVVEPADQIKISFEARVDNPPFSPPRFKGHGLDYPGRRMNHHLFHIKARHRCDFPFSARFEINCEQPNTVASDRRQKHDPAAARIKADRKHPFVGRGSEQRAPWSDTVRAHTDFETAVARVSSGATRHQSVVRDPPRHVAGVFDFECGGPSA